MASNRKETSHNVEFAKGGNTHMLGPQKAGEQAADTTAHDAGSGSGDKFAKGGSGKMFGFAGSESAQAGKTSAR